MSAAPSVDVHLPPGWAAQALRHDIRRAVRRHPRRLPPRWLYDERGSDLFDQITRLPAYYPTETERGILRRAAADIVRRSGADTVIELGSGTSDKTRTLLDAFAAAGQLERFVPFDVSEPTLRAATEALAARYPGVRIHGIVGDFTLHLAHLPATGRRLVAFLGGTLGNFYLEERHAFLGALADTLTPRDSVLLGVDLVKPYDRLHAAYADPEGVTEAFIKNILHVVNRELGADFDVHAFDYVPFWDPTQTRMDLRLRVNGDHHVSIPGADTELDLTDGEELHVEISTKFHLPALEGELVDAGLTPVHHWTDPGGDFALVLARPG